jgi:glycosyltransferase involved in cell wall biosynthesis
MTNSSIPRVLVCIPAYNEARNIYHIIKKAKAYASEIIVCDDGSVDNTEETAKAAGATVIRHPINKGYGNTIRTLFKAAKEANADVMVTLDSDGQHNPDQIPDVLRPIFDEGVDVVIGSRFLKEEDKKKVPSYRSFGIKAITKLTQVASYKYITDAQSGFRAYGKNALSQIDLFENGMAASVEILLRAKEKNLLLKEVPVTISYGTKDTSTHNPMSHGISVMGTVIRFILLNHPLLFFGVLGIIMLIIAAIFLGNAL